MKYEMAENKDFPGEWRVEGIDADGGVHVTNFSGPFSEQRAALYLDMMTRVD